MARKKKQAKKNEIVGMFWVALVIVVLAVVILGIASIPKGDNSNNVYVEYAGLYHSETGLKHCLTATACLTSTEVYLSDTGLCSIGGAEASSKCHWESKGANKISIEYESDESLSYSNVELVENGIIIKGVLFTRVRR